VSDTVASGQGAGPVRWTPDRHILYTANVSGNDDIWAVRPDGSDLQQLTTSTGFDGFPTVAPDGRYIAFSVAKEHFTFHTLDFEAIDELKALLPEAKFGRGSAKIKFSDRAAIPVLFDMCGKIVARAGKGNSSKWR
jgi:hypothetical protein